jgi:ribosomal protein L7/L12
MASKEVTLRAGESMTLQLETAGKIYRLNLSLTEHGVSVSAPAEAKVELHAASVAAAPGRGHERSQPAEEPVIESDFPVDIPADSESSPVEVPEESHDMSETDFSLDEEESQEATAQDFTVAQQHDSSIETPEDTLAGAENFSLTGVPGVSHSEEITLDEPGFSDEGLTMVPPSRGSRSPQPEPEPEPLLEMEDNAQPLDAVSATLSPVRFHDPATDNLEQPEMEEKRPAAPAPQLKKPLGPAPRPGQPAPRAAQPAPVPSEELPPWTGRARDYRDPKLEAKKAATSKIDKNALAARQPAPEAMEDQPLDLALEDEPAPAKPVAPAPKPAPIAAKPAPAIAPKPAPIAAKPAPAPAPKPAPVAAKPAPAPAKPAAPAKAEGNFTVFLSPPKGADKKQAAAEIIAEVQGIDINAATQLAGKMIVPVVKGVTEEDANKVRDRLKDAGLSCRITQKR